MTSRQVDCLIAFVAVTVLIYLPLISFGFVADDHLTLPKALPQFAWWDVVNLLRVDRYPLTTWTFDRQVGSSAGAYHMGNLLLHLANGLLLAWLVRRWRDWPMAVMLLGLAIFWLHPLQVETVAHVSARSELLVAFGLLVALHGVVRQWPLIIVGALVMVAARPSGIFGLLPVALIVLVDRPRHWQELMAFCGVGLLATAFAAWERTPSLVALQGWTWPGWVAVQTQAITIWLVQVVVPVGLTIDPAWALATPTWAIELATLAVVVAVIAGWMMAMPLARALLAWLAATIGWRLLLPTQEFFAPQDGYVAMMGVSVVIAAGVYLLIWNREVA